MNSLIPQKVAQAAVVTILVITATLLTFFSEKSPLLSGYGSDGLYYGHYAITLQQQLPKHEFPARGFERMFGIAAVNIIASTFNISVVPDSTLVIDKKPYLISHNIVLIYMVYNLLLYFLSLFLWHKIVSRLRLNIWVYILSFILLFINFSNLKQYFYEPVMLDPTTFTFALLLLYAWLYRSAKNLLAVSILALVVNIAAVYVCLVLLAFKREDVHEEVEQKLPAAILASATSLVVAGLSIYYFVYPLCSSLMENETIRPLFAISALAVSTVVFVIAYNVFANVKVPTLSLLAKNIRPLYALFYLAIIIATHAIFNNYAATETLTICDDKPHSLYNFFISILRLANTRPAGFLSAHLAYFGILLPFMLLNGKWIITQFIRNGYGAIAFLGITGVMFLNTESRQFLLMLPFIVYFIISNPLYRKMRPWHTVTIGIVSLGLSKIWLVINPLDPTKYATDNMQDFYDLYKFPMQRYFMNLGPWMSNDMYVVHLITAILCTAGLYLLHKNLEKEEVVVV